MGPAGGLQQRNQDGVAINALHHDLRPPAAAQRPTQNAAIEVAKELQLPLCGRVAAAKGGLPSRAPLRMPDPSVQHHHSTGVVCLHQAAADHQGAAAAARGGGQPPSLDHQLFALRNVQESVHQVVSDILKEVAARPPVVPDAVDVVGQPYIVAQRVLLWPELLQVLDPLLTGCGGERLLAGRRASHLVHADHQDLH